MQNYTQEQLNEIVQQYETNDAAEKAKIEQANLAFETTKARLTALGLPDPTVLCSPLTLFTKIGNFSSAISEILTTHPAIEDPTILNILSYSSVVANNQLRTSKPFMVFGGTIDYSERNGEVLRITHEGQHIEGEALGRVTALSRRRVMAVVKGTSCYLTVPYFQVVNHHGSNWLVLGASATKEPEASMEVKSAAVGVLTLIIALVDKSTEKHVFEGVVALAQSFRDWIRDRQSSAAEEWPTVEKCLAACMGMIKQAAIMEDEAREEEISRAGQTLCEVAEFVTISISEEAKIVEWLRRCKSKTKLRTILMKMKIRLPVFATPGNKPSVKEGIDITTVEMDRAGPKDYVLLEKQKASSASITTLLENPGIKVYTFKDEKVLVAVGSKPKGRKNDSTSTKKAKVVNYVQAATKPISFFQAIRQDVIKPATVVPTTAQLTNVETTAVNI